MSSSILLAYASSYGSTQEVAQAIAETLRGCGLAIDLLPAKQVKTLSGYRAVVLGAPLYMFRWHADAKSFLSRYHSVLAGLPVAIFALGPFHNKEEELTGAREHLDKDLTKFPWLKPAAVEVFVGKFDPSKLRFPFSLIPALKNMLPSDERDWDAIRGWATEIAGVLKEKAQ